MRRSSILHPVIRRPDRGDGRRHARESAPVSYISTKTPFPIFRCTNSLLPSPEATEDMISDSSRGRGFDSVTRRQSSGERREQARAEAPATMALHPAGAMSSAGAASSVRAKRFPGRLNMKPTVDWPSFLTESSRKNLMEELLSIQCAARTLPSSAVVRRKQGLSSLPVDSRAGKNTAIDIMMEIIKEDLLFTRAVISYYQPFP